MQSVADHLYLSHVAAGGTLLDLFPEKLLFVRCQPQIIPGHS